MASEDTTIAETIDEIRAALREYIEATYHVGHPAVIERRRALLDEEGVIFRAPFIESTPRYQTGKHFDDLNLEPAAKELLARLTTEFGGQPKLLHDPPYRHQAEALELTSRDGLSLAITTGTGSGKTESFLLPMLSKLASEAANRPQSFASPAIRTLILYPMNALVNDQLSRLRLLLGDPRVTEQFTAWAGRPARFARYTSRTLYPGVRKVSKDQQRLASIGKFYVQLLEQAADPSSPWHTASTALIEKLRERGRWPAKPDIEAWYGRKGSRWTNSDGEFTRAITQDEDPELLTRHEVLAAPPDVLITNYSMLEYMLMRPLERPIFDATRQWLTENPDEKFLLVVDEAHLYRGAAGAEVALLLRRLSSRLGIQTDRLQVVCTSASFADQDYAREFAAQLTGKDVNDFRTVVGHLALHEGGAIGSPAEANALASIPLRRFYEGEADAERTLAVADFLKFRGVSEGGGNIGELLVSALRDFGPMKRLINETMQRAQPVSELGRSIFPDVDVAVADQAVTALVALGSAARRAQDEAGLLPCRVHAFFRGLPGLWACVDPDCPEVDAAHHPGGGPIGKLYAQPRATCDCGARVFEYFTCRHCGSSYARVYTDDVLNPTFLWHEQGGAFQSATGSIPELFGLDLLLEDPTEGNVEPADLDLVTGQLNPEKLGDRIRGVFLPLQRGGEPVEVDEEDEDDKSEANGEFKPCGVCGRNAGFGRSSVQDHQTKGDQPFQALVARQIEVQPPSSPYSDFAPLRGRKVLAFSDSRQVAARLAPNLQNYSMRDVIRPLILRGWTDLANVPGLAHRLNLEKLYLATMVGAKQLSVRLRPELKSGESLHVLKEVSTEIESGALDGNAEAAIGLLALTAPPPESLLRAIYATLTDRYYGFTSLGLASLKEKASLTNELLANLPAIDGVANTDEEKLALVRLWIAQWSVPTRGIWFSSMTDGEWWKVKGGVKSHAGKFKPVERWIGSTDAKRIFNQDWLPTLLGAFTELQGNKYRMLAGNIALDLDGAWGYCDRCRFTQRPFPGTNKCVACGNDSVRVLDPNSDEVFHARKGYYRASAVRALENPPELPMSIIAAEHTAQLNAAQSDEVFSRAEQYELLFQDVDVALPRAGSTELAAIDVLSCTTTMEVGIDIGALSGVALRNMPPSRANYQQRAGRAGRRGNAIATVIAFGSADTHDDHYFREPAQMIRGEVDDPVLTMDNDEIARRHVTAYLLQRYHQDRLPTIDPEDQPQLFEVLGTVPEFTDPASPLNRTDFSEWLRANEAVLRDDVDAWLPDELAAGRQDVLDGLVTITLDEIDDALDIEPGGELSSPEEGDSPPETEEVEDEPPAEDGAELPTVHRSQTNLLDRLLYKGVLPRYAFPTDVVGFHVFDIDKSEPFRAEFRYAPSQGLPIALSQYAPGKVVWIDNKEWTSGAIYAPVHTERFEAWRGRWLYFECQVCHYAMHVPQDEAQRGEERDCPACGAEAKFGKAMNWMRPPGFAHRALDEPGTSPDDAPAISYATRAKLVAEGPSEETEWDHVTERLEQTYRRDTLLVTNTGPRSEGYNYCAKCGLIEPTARATGIVFGSHKKPYPDEREPDCPGSASTRGLVLGTDFISDVLLIRLKVENPVTLTPELLSTHVALRSIAEALTITATKRLGIESSELQAEYRPALTSAGSGGLESEIYLYDTLAGGAGFTRRVHQLGLDIFEETLKRLESCPTDCDESCYRCLRSFRNRFEHQMLDRKVGASLLRYILYGTPPTLDQARLDLSARKLMSDLASRDIGGVEFFYNEPTQVDGIGTVPAPILMQRGDRRWIFYVHSPLTRGLAPTKALADAKEYGNVPVLPIDDMAISRNLPFASQQVLKYLA